MFNLQPGQGLGQYPYKLLAFGLGEWLITYIPVCIFTKSIVIKEFSKIKIVKEFSRIKTIREFFVNGRCI